MISRWRQSPNRAELTWGFSLSLALHGLVAGLIFLFPSLWAGKFFRVPVVYEVRLVGSLPGSPSMFKTSAGTASTPQDSIPQERLGLPQASSVRSGLGESPAGRPSQGEELMLPRRIGIGSLEALRFPGWRGGASPSAPAPKVIGERPTDGTGEAPRPGVEPLLPGEVARGSPGSSFKVAKAMPPPASAIAPQVVGTPSLPGREGRPKEVGVSSKGEGSSSVVQSPMTPLAGAELTTSKPSRDVLKDLPGRPITPQKVSGGASEPLVKGGPKAIGPSPAQDRPSSMVPSPELLLKGAGEKARMTKGKSSEEALMPTSPPHPRMLPSRSPAGGNPKALAERPRPGSSARPTVNPLLAGQGEGARGVNRRVRPGLEAPELPQQVGSPSGQALHGGPKVIGGAVQEAPPGLRSRVDPLLGEEREGPRTARRIDEMPVVPPARQMAIPQGPTFPGGLERGGGGGSGVIVENADPRLSYYFTLLQYKISSRWSPPRIGPGRVERVVVSFKILRSGLIDELTVDSPSGNKLLDDSAIRAIRDAVPLPPLPNLFRDESLSIQLRFTYIGEKA